MFDGKTFLPVTGMPMRKIACMSRLFALAEPVPLTVPILNAKSLTRVRAARRGCDSQRHLADAQHVPRRFRSARPAYGISSSNWLMSHAAVGQRSAQRPQCRQTSSSFTMMRFVCGSGADDVERLRRDSSPAPRDACADRTRRRRRA